LSETSIIQYKHTSNKPREANEFGRRVYISIVLIGWEGVQLSGWFSTHRRAKLFDYLTTNMNHVLPIPVGGSVVTH
jgi:hypothetical protein